LFILSPYEFVNIQLDVCFFFFFLQLKEVLEKTLDDDADMKDFNLSALEEERLESVNRQAARSASGTPFDIPIAATLGSVSALTPQVAKSIASSASSDSFSDDEDVEVVEQLLESYFMRLDNTWNRLQTLTEYVDDTEDFINIELDSHRNQLIRLDIVLTSFTACMGLITAITGLFAMNLKLRPNAEDSAPYSWFVIISTSAGAFAILLFVSVMLYCRWKRLL
jgi:magnesium transporter